ncbi:MAG: hypothetical protein LC799_34400, partial [Actinobacteria bacterium]|nr:hypothetical protein [Actinomycetota bacterium]
LYGLGHGLGLYRSAGRGALAATATALVAANGPMVLLGVTDPRSWSGSDWLADLVPHAAYGAVTAATYAAATRSDQYEGLLASLLHWWPRSRYAA